MNLNRKETKKQRFLSHQCLAGNCSNSKWNIGEKIEIQIHHDNFLFRWSSVPDPFSMDIPMALSLFQCLFICCCEFVTNIHGIASGSVQDGFLHRHLGFVGFPLFIDLYAKRLSTLFAFVSRLLGLTTTMSCYGCSLAEHFLIYFLRWKSKNTGWFVAFTFGPQRNV